VPTYRLTLEYEGTRYHGWQEQANARSVAGEVRRAIVAAGGDIVELGASGRTDAGVQALAQVAHLRLRHPVEPAPFRRAVNDALSPDIHMLDVRQAADSFHERHGATSRIYLYQISRRRSALAKRFVWWVKRPLDVAVMAGAAKLLEGRHDFSLFCERPKEQESTLVVVERGEVVESGALILVRLSASHFLWKMMRRVVGVLVRVGAGEVSLDEIEALAQARLPESIKDGIAAWTAPSSGLFLERVLYPGDPEPPPIAAAVAVPAE